MGASARIDPDADLIERSRAGDRSGALRGIMQRHGAAVYRYCREALQDAALADDVHQLVFIQVDRDLSRFAGRSSLRTWLFAIAHHRVLDALKARRRKQAHLEREDVSGIAADGIEPWQHLDDVRLRELLALCVELLPEHIRTPLVLRYQLGFTFEEMAEVCGEKAGTLQARVARAIPMLRACLGRRHARKR